MRVPIIRIALSIGGSETIDKMVMSVPPRSPSRTRAASAAGNVERARSSLERAKSSDDEHAEEAAQRAEARLRAAGQSD